MKDMLVFLVSALVDHPEDVNVNQTNQEGKSVLVLHVHPEDMGKIIGKNGRIIKAVRDLVKIIAAKRNTYIDVVLDESKLD